MKKNNKMSSDMGSVPDSNNEMWLNNLSPCTSLVGTHAMAEGVFDSIKLWQH